MTTRSNYPSEREDDIALLRDAITDVPPPLFRDRIDRRLQEAVTIPGLVTRLAARAADRDFSAEEIDRRVVGVQLIYEGLKLTRTLARYPPWDDERADDADLEILVAEVLVAKGFSLLARTEAMPVAVEAVRAFGRDETNRRVGESDSDPPDHALEADVFELGIVAGVTATGAQRPPEAHTFAMKLAESLNEEIDDEEAALSDSDVEDLTELL